jgi:hypothetical protein
VGLEAGTHVRETKVVRGELKWSGDTRSEMLGVGMATRCAAVFRIKDMNELRLAGPG